MLFSFLACLICMKNLVLIGLSALGQLTGLMAPGGAQKGGQGLVCISHVSWSKKIWQRNHHTMVHFSKKWKIVYCCPMPAHDIADRPRHVVSLWRERVNQNLFSFICPILPGDSKLHSIQFINRIILYSALRRHSDRMGIEADILWFYYPQYVYILRFYKKSLILFDIMDDYTALTRSTRIIRDRETRLLEQSDHTFTGTYALFSSRKSFARSIEFVPCGVEFDHFHQAADVSLPPADDMARYPSPVIGYVGHIGRDRIDMELLEFLAKTHPAWTLVLIGPMEKNGDPFPSMSNLKFIGARDYQTLPRYLKRFDICIIPFLLNKLTLSINPTKMLEYLAAGKPVISTPLPDVERFYQGLVKIAKDQEGFEQEILNLLSTDTSELVRQGIAFAESRSWSGMAEKMIDSMESKIQEKQGKGV